MRRILLALAGVVVVVVAIVIGRTLLAPVYKSVPANHASAFDENTVATHLAAAVKFRTISWQDGG